MNWMVRALTSSYNKERVLQLCQAYGVEVKEGTGIVSLNGKEFDFKTILENGIPSSVLSLDLLPATRINDIVFQEEGKQIQYTTSFIVEKWTTVAA